MKIRVGFVSNSSDCSFVCVICGNEEDGWDWNDTPRSNDMGICENGHILCREHFSYKKTKIDIVNDKVPAKFCPLCKLGVADLKHFLMKNKGRTVDDLMEELYGDDCR